MASALVPIEALGRGCVDQARHRPPAARHRRHLLLLPDLQTYEDLILSCIAPVLLHQRSGLPLAKTLPSLRLPASNGLRSGIFGVFFRSEQAATGRKPMKNSWVDHQSAHCDPCGPQPAVQRRASCWPELRGQAARTSSRGSRPASDVLGAATAVKVRRLC